MHRHQKTLGEAWKKGLVFPAKLRKTKPAHIAFGLHIDPERSEPVAGCVEIVTHKASAASRFWRAPTIGQLGCNQAQGIDAGAMAHDP
jgi:hypothetical protein